MAKANIRMFSLNHIKDLLNSNANWLDMGVTHVEPKFVNDKSITGARYGMGAYAFNFNESISMNFSTTFTIAFWAKAVRGAIDDNVYKNNIVLVLETGDKLIVEIPDFYDLTEWHFYVITRDDDNNINFCIDTAVLDTKMQSGDFNLGSNSYFFLGNQNRYATGFTFEVDDIIIFDGSVDSSFKPDDYVSTNVFTQLLVIDSSGQVWGYSWDGSTSGSGGGADVTTVPSATLSLASETDEVVIPKGITAIRYTLTEDGQEITREIAVESTDTVKYYKEEDGYYTLAIYGSDGAIKSKGYTLHSDDIPNIDITYSADVNNNFTSSDKYNGYVALTEVDYSADTEFVVPAGVTKIEYSAGESGVRIAEVEVGDILEYTADPNDSSKFTLTVYDKDKNKKRDLYTWNNDNLHFSYGTAKANSNNNSESGYEDVSYSLPDVNNIDFVTNGQRWEVPSGTEKLKVQSTNVKGSFGSDYVGVGSLVQVPEGSTIISFRQYYDMTANYGILDSDRLREFYTTPSGNRKYKLKLRVWYGKLINEMEG